MTGLEKEVNMKMFENIFGSKANNVYKSIAEGNVEEISDYLKSTKNIDIDFEPDSILHYAIDNCKNNYEETIKFLINNYDNINSHDSKYSNTPLHKLCARTEPSMSLIRLLLWSEPPKVDCLISEDLCHYKAWNGWGCFRPLAFLDPRK